MVQSTTALRKISGLKKRIWNILGGQGSGKTYSILIILINHALTNENKEIFIASAELSKMRITVIKDFVNLLKDFNLHNKVQFLGGTHAKFPNGSFIKFIGLDKEDIGKGLRSDVIFVNEANKTKFETYRELTSRAKRIIIDYNPNKKYWANTEVATRKDCDSLVLTYLDNEFLSNEEVNEILSYKKKGYDKDGKIINEYWANKWRIYGLGEVGGVEGRIFHWKEIGYNDYIKIDRPYLVAADWGTSDPFAIIEMKYYDGALYVHELNYKSENEWRKRLSTTEMHQITGSNNDGLVTWLFNRLNIYKDVDVICDNNRPTKILALRENGWDRAVAARKGAGSILDGIDLLQNLSVYYTSTSVNIANEQQEYCWRKDRFDIQLEEAEDANNHCFVGDTLIATDKGQIKIKDIKRGDYVLTSKGYKKVLKKFNNGVKKVNKYSFKLEKENVYLTSTPSHKVKTTKGFKPISKLKAGDLIYLNSYASLKQSIVSVSVQECIESEVYDLMVEDCHEYYANGLLVHNCIDAIRYGSMYLRSIGVIRKV